MMQQIALVLLIAVSSVAGWKQYVNDANSYKLKYPDTWTQKDMGTAVVFLSPLEDSTDAFMENINLVMEDLSQQPMTLEQYASVSLNQLKYDVGTDGVLSFKDTMLAGLKAKEIIYTMNQRRLVKIKQFFTIRKNTAYLFSYTAEPAKFEKFESVATEAMQSLEFF